MSGENRWYKAKWEATGQPCEVIAVYQDGEAGPLLQHIVLADGRKLTRIDKGRYQTLRDEVVVSADPMHRDLFLRVVWAGCLEVGRLS
jgi:hypothetical protein